MTAPDQAAADAELERWGFKWHGHDNGTHVQMADGYWTPWHIANARIEALSRQPSREVTEAMVEAGRDAFYDCGDVEDVGTGVVVSAVYRAMLAAQGEG